MWRAMNGIRFAFAFVAVIGTVHCASAAELSITLATTPSVETTGLLANILPQFTAKSGIAVKVVWAGHRQGARYRAPGRCGCRAGSRSCRGAGIDEGYGTTRRQVAWNDFVLVGPSGDPAKIIGAKDASTAVKAIAAARARFVTRGDRSDVNIAELRLWRFAGRTSEALTPEKWYRSVNGDMNQALDAASTTDAYTLSDRGTWLAFANKGPLVIAVEGDRRLLDRYDVIELNPKKHGKARLPEAKIFADWLVSFEGQQAIESYRPNGQQPFHASTAGSK
jgi:tungstate transport system substrate-binding protein